MNDFKLLVELEFVLFFILTVSTAKYDARSQFSNHFRELVGQVYFSSMSSLSMLISSPFLSHIYFLSNTAWVALVGTELQWHCSASHDLHSDCLALTVLHHPLLPATGHLPSLFVIQLNAILTIFPCLCASCVCFQYLLGATQLETDFAFLGMSQQMCLCSEGSKWYPVLL